jgi:hypothetical protein
VGTVGKEDSFLLDRLLLTSRDKEKLPFIPWWLCVSSNHSQGPAETDSKAPGASVEYLRETGKLFSPPTFSGTRL